MRKWQFESSSSSNVYTTQIGDNGLLSCTCPGWTTKKLGKVRDCKHCKQVARDEKLVIEIRDEQQFVIPGTGKIVPAAVPTTVIAPAPQSAPKPQGFLSPMLASKMPSGKDADSYSATEYVLEEKYDGHRIVMQVADGSVTAWSRLGNRRTLPDQILRSVVHLPNGMYDGELMVPGNKSYGVTAGMNSGLEEFVLFDVMHVLGNNVMKEPLSTRRKLLEMTYGHIDGAVHVALSSQMAPSTADVRRIWSEGGEGAIIKKLSAPYREGYRSPDWLKVKAVAAETLTIVGYQPGESGPYSSVKLRDDNGIETTVKTIDNRMLREFAANPDSYIGKRLVISYQEKTPTGKYRHPMFDHLAGDHE